MEIEPWSVGDCKVNILTRQEQSEQSESYIWWYKILESESDEESLGDHLK